MNDEVVLSDGTRIRVPVASPSELQPPPKTVQMEKVVNVWGSAAGAGSDFFDIYRKYRNIEMHRLDKMEADWKAKIEEEEFTIQREQRRLELEAKIEKRKERRKRKKYRGKDADGRKKPKKVAAGGCQEGEAEVESDAEDEDSGAQDGEAPSRRTPATSSKRTPHHSSTNSQRPSDESPTLAGVTRRGAGDDLQRESPLPDSDRPASAEQPDASSSDEEVPPMRMQVNVTIRDEEW